MLDTGLDAGHPALGVPSSHYDHDYASAEDIVGHGTHVAALVSGRAVNGRFGGGVSDATIRAWKIFDDTPDPQDGEYYVDEVLYQRALVEAQRAKCRVVNLSIGASGSTRTEQRAIKRLIDAGIVVVAAMGNEYLEGNPTSYPAAYEGVLSVGASDTAHKRAAFSNTGAHIDLVAPGVEIHSAVPRKASISRTEENYAAWDGTSMATPIVAGAVGRLGNSNCDLTGGRD